MTPAELSERLRALQARTAALPAEFERVAQATVLQGIPRTTSVEVSRAPDGVRVTLSGRGASWHASRLAPKLRAAGRVTVVKAAHL
jgi:hypothetical protein